MEVFIINQEVEFHSLNPTLYSSSLTKDSAIKLDYLESTVLDLLIRNVDSLVTYEEFLSHWRSSEATENSLSRVISLLRKKLKQAGLTENVIINTAKKGYTFVANVEFRIEEKPTNKPPKLTGVKSAITDLSTINKTPLFSFLPKKMASIAATLILALAFSLVNINAFDTQTINIEKTSFTELFSDTDIKTEFSYNLLNDNIAYSNQVFDEAFWQIKILNRYGGQTVVLKELNKNLNKPAWLNTTELIYRQSDETSCEIKKATINVQSNNPTSVKLFPCNPNSYASALAKFGDNRILIADAELNNTAASLFIGDLQTGMITKVNLDNGGGAGFYNIVTTPYSELVALLSSSDGTLFKIQLVDPNNKWRTIWQEELKATNFSVGWDGSSLSFRNDKGGISLVSFDDKREIKRINVPTLSPTHNISSTNQGVMMTSGELTSQDLTFYDSATNEEITFTQGSSAKNKLAAFYGDNQIIYVSNKTGINQIWLYDLSSAEAKQLSSFTTNKNIRALSLAPLNGLVAIQVDDNIELFNFTESLKLSSLLTSINGINPVIVSGQLVFTKYDGINSSIRALSFDNLEETELKIEGAFFAQTNGEQLLYSKRYLPGIWQYQPNADDKLVLELPSSSYRWFVNGNKIYYQNDIGEYFQYDLEKQIASSFNLPNCPKPVAFSGTRCISKRLVPSENRLVLLEW